MANEITKNKLLLVEGKDEINFFQALLKKIGKAEDIQIIQVGGKDKFRHELPALVNATGLSDVEVITIIRDADDNSGNAFKSIENILKEIGLASPEMTGSFSNGQPRVGIYIMPGSSETGMLEDLCLKTQSDHPIMSCVDAFMKCVASREGIEQPSNPSKAKSQVFLAGMPKIVNCVGQGALKDYWNLDHECLRELIEFLEQI